MPRKIARPFFSSMVFAFLLLVTAIVDFYAGGTHRLRNPISSTSLHHRQLVVFGTNQTPPFPPPPTVAAVLLPDWELVVLLLLPPGTTKHRVFPPLSCLFQNHEKSMATFSGFLPWTNRQAYTCSIPMSLRRQRGRRGAAIPAPMIVDPKSPMEWRDQGHIIRWNHMVYESFSTSLDVVVFAKGINTRQTSNLPPSNLRCVFSSGRTTMSTAVTSSSQEVFRCQHPDLPQLKAEYVTVTLEVVGGSTPMVIPSVAQYHRPPAQDREVEDKSLICVCTMVHDVAKFLREWVMYHSAVGVNEFFLYDNGSDDDLDGVVRKLRHEGFVLTTYLWPWAKTQEAGFSHCAVAHRDACKWMLFIDVDEFAFSPSWALSNAPSMDMISSFLPGDEEKVGQVEMYCLDYGPSGQRKHPPDGVTQGYICRRRRKERHKSIVRLEAVDESLTTVVHHFKLKEGYAARKLSTTQGLVNHYKYQAWPEFRTKFRRRVSAYVVDWTQLVNMESKDRTLGLGVEPVVPNDWPHRFCDVNDTRLKHATRTWFDRVQPDGNHRLAWQ